MLDKRVERLEDKIGEVEVDTATALSNISKDIHIMSENSSKMESALTKLLESEVRFQLHQQKDEQYQADNARLFRDLFSRMEKVENKTNTVLEDHAAIIAIKKSIFNAAAWVIGGITTGIALAFVGVVYYVAKNGGF